MQKAQLIRWKGVKELRDSVDDNVRLYRDGCFVEKISADKIMEDPSVEVDEDALSRLNPDRQADIENALLVFKSLKGMHPHLARDERFWVYLTHFSCREYTWQCVLRPEDREKGLAKGASAEEKEALVERIRDRFFAHGNRGFIRNNALSRLWWWAYIASRYVPQEGKDNVGVKKVLEVLLSYTNLRDAIIERPSSTRGKNVFSALMDILIERHDKDPQSTFIKRTSIKDSLLRAPYKEWMKEINRHGGVLLLEAMPRDELKGLLEKLAIQAEQAEQE